MGIKLKADSITNAFLLVSVAESYMKDKGINLLQLTDEDGAIIQNQYDICMYDIQQLLSNQ
jgi:hypothetical protein